ncbi:MAG TPA: MFS transporter, partial [Anaerolineae bacterium]|nr:MFS transporter [Anaerolineae bacterium]
MEDSTTTLARETSRPSVRDVLRLRNFKLLWLGEAVSLIGDQFYLIALPWLVLQMTGDALAVGAVLALAGIPRAIFMLVGGALTDRFSPRIIMLVSNLLRLGLISLLAVLIIGGAIQLWMLYIFALLFGLADAFFYPAQSSIIPQIVAEKDLQTGNAIVQGTAQLSLFLGPVMAGGMIALFAGRTTETASLRGIGLAMAVDAATFLVSAVTLWFIKLPRPSTNEKANPAESVLSAIKQGLVYVWRDETLRIFFLVVAAISTLLSGVFAVGIPVLVNARFTEGAVALGLIMSAFGAGSLLGTGLAGLLPKPPQGHLGTILLLGTAVMGLALISFAFVHSLPLAILTSLVNGIADGYVVIMFITWLQLRTPEAMLGRMMSLLMFASAGLEIGRA